MTSLLTFGQPLVLVATRPEYSACWVARTLGIWVASLAPICRMAFAHTLTPRSFTAAERSGVCSRALTCGFSPIL